MTDQRADFVDLNRQFRELDDSLRTDQIALQSYTLLGTRSDNGWERVLKSRLAVVLGEPGSGKTWEVQERARLMSERGDFAFYVRLEELAKDDLESVLGPADRQRFHEWLRSQANVTCFLDSVDESKLESPRDFHTALRRLREALDDGALGRVRLVVTSRISEWQPELDRSELLRLFGATARIKKLDPGSTAPVEEFDPGSSLGQDSDRSSQPLLVVALEPLNKRQVETLARASGLGSPEEFLAAVDRAHAWEFVRRPLDVADLLVLWLQEHRIGSLTELLEFTVRRHLRETPERERADTFPSGRLRAGAETLAAATVFCRELTFGVSPGALVDGQQSARGLDASACLPADWSAEERAVLLSRPVFDGASYGRVRFHHRRIGEYLAAQWIARRVSEGCPVEEVEALLCDVRGGRRVLRPSLLRVAAWLCADGGQLGLNARGWMLDAAPQAHLQYGDPGPLPLEYKRSVLRRIVERFSDRRRVWVDTDTESLSRLADPALATDVVTILRDASVSTDLRAMLLMFVRFGGLQECLDTALDILLSPAEPTELKSYAAAAIRDVPNVEIRRGLLERLDATAVLPALACTILCEALYPGDIDSRGLADLLRKASPSIRDLPYYLKSHLTNVVRPEDAAALVRDLLSLGQSPPYASAEGKEIRVSERFAWVGEILPVVVLKALEKEALNDSEIEIVAQALIFLNRYRRLNRHERSSVELPPALARHSEVRRRTFWLLVDEWRSLHDTDPGVPWFVFGPEPIFNLAANDLAWLTDDIRERTNSRDRVLATRFALQVSTGAPTARGVRKRISQAVASDGQLREVFDAFARARRFWRIRHFWNMNVRSKLLQRWWWERRRLRFKRSVDDVREQLLLLRNLRHLRSGERLGWLASLVSEARGEREHGRLTPSSWKSLEDKRGQRVAKAAREGCKRYWRTFVPPLPHEGEPNRIDHRVIIGLAGIAAGLEDGDLDFASVTGDAARQLARYALGELNGFPPWLYQLARAQTAVVRDVLCECVRAEWRFAVDRTDVYEVLHDLAWHGNELRLLVSETILTLIASGGPANAVILQSALTVLFKDGDIPSTARPVLVARLAGTATEDVTFATWFAAAMQIDANEAITLVERRLQDTPAEERAALMVRLCAVLSEGRGGHREVPSLREPDYLEPGVLARLIPLVYEHVRPDADIVRAGQGTYSPSDRDAAQDFRDALLNRLASLDRAQSLAVLRELHGYAALAQWRDLIAHLIDASSARMSDMHAWRESDVRAFAEQHEVPARTHDGLMEIACKRLRDIKRQVETDEISLREELRVGDHEGLLRRWLARKLRERARARYTVPQEVEIDLGERPDLRIECPGMAAVPIEVKWAEKWSVRELLERLETQLAGQYLRDHNARNGLYVVGTIEIGRRWEHPDTGVRISFEDVVAIVRARAEVLARERADVDRIEVVGIDFRDPRLIS